MCVFYCRGTRRTFLPRKLLFRTYNSICSQFYICVVVNDDCIFSSHLRNRTLQQVLPFLHNCCTIVNTSSCRFRTSERNEMGLMVIDKIIPYLTWVAWHEINNTIWQSSFF